MRIARQDFIGDADAFGGVAAALIQIQQRVRNLHVIRPLIVKLLEERLGFGDVFEIAGLHPAAGNGIGVHRIVIILMLGDVRFELLQRDGVVAVAEGVHSFDAVGLGDALFAARVEIKDGCDRAGEKAARDQKNDQSADGLGPDIH